MNNSARAAYSALYPHYNSVFANGEGVKPRPEVKENSFMKAFRNLVNKFLYERATKEEKKKAAFAFFKELNEEKEKVGNKFDINDYIIMSDHKMYWKSIQKKDEFKEYEKEFEAEHKGAHHKGGRRTRKQTRRRRGRGRKGTRRG